MHLQILTAAIVLLLSAATVEAVDIGLPTVGTTDGLGVNIHTFYNGDLDTVRAAGLNFVRMDLNWSSVESTQGVYDFSGFDYLVSQCSERGIRVLAILDYGNSLYGTNQNTTSWRNGFTNFAKAAVARYQGTGNIYEIYNEPNGSFWPGSSKANQYMALVKQAAPAMHVADPNCTIVAPAVAGIDTAFLTTCFKQGLASLVDAVSVHPYRGSSPETVVSDYATVRSLMQTNGGKIVPIVSSEWGYSTGTVGASYTPVANAQLQGDYAARMALVNLSQNIPLSVWYDLKDDGTDPRAYEQNFGLETSGNVVKPAYNELHLLTASLKGTTFSQALNDGNSADWLLEYALPNGQKTLAAWTTGDAHAVTVSSWGTLHLTSTPFYVNPVPEPGSLILCGIGAIGLLTYAWRKRK